MPIFSAVLSISPPHLLLLLGIIFGLGFLTYSVLIVAMTLISVIADAERAERARALVSELTQAQCSLLHGRKR
jgi:hypothetical protein